MDEHNHPHWHDHRDGGHHHHGHGHHHDHAPRGPGAERKIFWAMLLTGGFMLAEVAGAVVSGSLALLADAGHMFTDLAALALAYAGIRLGRRPADPQRTYGYRRLEVLAAFINGVTLVGLTLWITVEAVQRIADPVEVLSGPMFIVAVLGLVVNTAAFAILQHGHDEENVNVGGALVHVLGDMLGSVAAIAAATVIHFTGWMPIDPILSLVVAMLILRSGWAIVQRSAHILLEGTPPDIDVGSMKQDLAGVTGVAEARHLHVWSLTSGEPLATLHLRLAPDADPPAVMHAVKERLKRTFGIDHSTVEIDFDGEPGALAHGGRHHECTCAGRR